jgi:hypothetical protein
LTPSTARTSLASPSRSTKRGRESHASRAGKPQLAVADVPPQAPASARKDTGNPWSSSTCSTLRACEHITVVRWHRCSSMGHNYIETAVQHDVLKDLLGGGLTDGLY